MIRTTCPTPSDGVLLIFFGEPETAELSAATDFLSRIFLANARLESPVDAAAAGRRSRELAAKRAPGLVRDYERIGGSPLHRQAHAQRARLAAELAGRGRPIPVELGMQFTEPRIDRAIGTLASMAVRRIVALPVYPLCGPSTTIAGLDVARTAASRRETPIETLEVTGWHAHPSYVELRAAAIRSAAADAGLDLRAPHVQLVFSAHGTPVRYIAEGSRYATYVEQYCALVAGRLGLTDHVLGYQNHANRGIDWTRPPIDEVLDALPPGTAVLVDPVSFMHEQSETLSELDLDLREHAKKRGLGFHRVPVPHSDPRFVTLLADLAETALGFAPAGFPTPRVCGCRPGAAVCLNGETRPGVQTG